MNRYRKFLFVCKKLLIPRGVPSGWKLRRGRRYDWVLTADRGSSQPLGVYVKKFDAQVDNSYKNGYQATLGEFVGRYCRIAPLRSTHREALKDCFEFMTTYSDRRLLKSQLEEQYFVQNYASSIF